MELVKGFSYLWHPGSIECFMNQFGNSSRFSHSGRSDWIINITLIYWTIDPCSNGDGGKAETKRSRDDFDEDRHTYSISPPRTLGAEFHKDLHSIAPHASSIFVSTNPFGNFATFSVISKVIPVSSMQKVGETASEIRRMFIDQPQTGRCLIFLSLLGQTCEKIMAEYEDTLGTLLSKVELDVRLSSAKYGDGVTANYFF